MKPSDLGLLRVPGPPTLSPDGRTAIVALTRIDTDADDYTSQLWLVPVDGPRVRLVGSDFAPIREPVNYGR